MSGNWSVIWGYTPLSKQNVIQQFSLISKLKQFSEMFLNLSDKMCECTNCSTLVLMQKLLLWRVTLIDFELLLLFFSIVETRMFPSFMSVLLVTALTSVWAQDFYEERKTNNKARVKPLAANIHDGQGRKINTMNENIFA